MSGENRGRKPKIEFNSIIENELIKFKHEIVQDGNKIVGIQDDIWRRIAFNIGDKCKKEVTPASLRVCVALDLGGIKQKLEIEPIESNEVEEIYQKNVSSYSTSEEDAEERNGNELLFAITFSFKEWEAIRPTNKVYNCKRGPKTYQVMSPFEWSNVIQEHFFLHTKLPCCLVLKKANISFNGKFYLTIRGRCSDCGSIFDGIVKDIPTTKSRVIMECTYSGNYEIPHSKKRKLHGSERIRELTMMINENVNPSVFKRIEASRLMCEVTTHLLDFRFWAKR